LKSAPMAILAMALLQQHDARRDILTEPAAWRRAAIEAWGHSELGAFGTGGVRKWGHNRAVKTNWLVYTKITDTGLHLLERIDNESIYQLNIKSSH